MAVDVAVPRTLRAQFERGRYACIVATGPSDEGCFRIDAVQKIDQLLFRLQPGTWLKLECQRVFWTPGIVLARTLAGKIEKFLADRRLGLGNHWYRAELAVLDERLPIEARSLRAVTWTHAELIARLQHSSDAEADWIANGVS